MVGDTVELHCEALRGSAPILYQLYHEDVILRNSSAPSGRGVSFNLNLTTEHSGNYFCEADNGLGAQRSKAVALNVTGIAQDVGLSWSLPASCKRLSDITVYLVGCCQRWASTLGALMAMHLRGMEDWGVQCLAEPPNVMKLQVPNYTSKFLH